MFWARAVQLPLDRVVLVSTISWNRARNRCWPFVCAMAGKTRAVESSTAVKVRNISGPFSGSRKTILFAVLGQRSVLRRLLVQDSVEHGFLNVGFGGAACLVDKGVGTAGPEPGVLFQHAVFGGMIPERHVARQGPNELEGTVE